MSEPAFAPDDLIARAAEAEGVALAEADFGDEAFREGLEVLCETYRRHANPRGRKRNHRRLVGLLQARLRVQAAFHRHPEIRERELRRPLVLTGLPRSGTSAQFNLLARDPAARPLLLWETQFPDPPPGLPRGAEDPRYLPMKRYYEEARRKNPAFLAVHSTDADTPEECGLLHCISMSGVQTGPEVVLEPYGSWFRDQDLRGLYAEYADLLRMLDWRRSGERWTLKTPAHLWAIEALIEIFPDVGIVWSHRDPLRCVASIASMTWMMTEPYFEVKQSDVGERCLDFYATSLERGLAARDRCDPARFVDLHHDDFVADPMAAAQRVYERFDLPLTDAARACLQEHAAANPRGKHGRHDYELEDFGLRPEAVRERFTPYIERFGVETE